MVDHFAFIHQAAGADDIEMKHLVVLQIAKDSWRLFAPHDRLDRRHPESAHLDDAAVRVAEMFGGAVGDPALADLGRAVLAVDRRHVEFFPRAA